MCTRKTYFVIFDLEFWSQQLWDQRIYIPLWKIGFHMTCHFFRFQGIAIILSYVFHTFCLIYPAMSDNYFLSIGFHKTCYFFRFQGIANISSYDFYPFCLIYPVMSDKKILSIGFHTTCNFFRFQGIANIYVFHTFCFCFCQRSCNFLKKWIVRILSIVLTPFLDLEKKHLSEISYPVSYGCQGGNTSYYTITEVNCFELNQLSFGLYILRNGKCCCRTIKV